MGYCPPDCDFSTLGENIPDIGSAAVGHVFHDVDIRAELDTTFHNKYYVRKACKDLWEFLSVPMKEKKVILSTPGAGKVCELYAIYYFMVHGNFKFCSFFD